MGGWDIYLVRGISTAPPSPLCSPLLWVPLSNGSLILWSGSIELRKLYRSIYLVLGILVRCLVSHHPSGLQSLLSLPYHHTPIRGSVSTRRHSSSPLRNFRHPRLVGRRSSRALPCFNSHQLPFFPLCTVLRRLILVTKLSVPLFFSSLSICCL
ncbi:hypothetical protein K474DRAFT_52445 [Panus rudis PR-1116 ss-1]|nr:hypothetical protein K474DRAFT_52445 [Panus rudis PR-1116 ss-1]